MNFLRLVVFLSLVPACLFGAEPQLLDNQFELPEGFHIYRVAKPSLTGGSYDITFDGEGKLLVGDGNAIRRLEDHDQDGIYDSHTVIADGPPVSGRGPQGLLVLGDNLFSVSGDGVQLFSGYNSGKKLKFERRLGAPFRTGGDHAAHTVLRGIDGYIYLVTGDGGGTSGRKHITEETSPARQERAASVFRFDPAGKTWECIGTGGRNPPSLGMNYLGEFFSFDSDMEFHVDVPFYRPVRLNHWATGGDQGWQSVGAFPPYYVDCLPGILNVGRGSPNWGVFYEHDQLPKRFRDAFIVCDYRWKSATSGRYATSGRLLSFHLTPSGAGWRGEFIELAKAKPGAKDADGNSINFALVDVDVAPDGSLFVSDHNQGIWRIFYDAKSKPAIPPIVPQLKNSDSKATAIDTLLRLPQPGSEWSRVREVALKEAAKITDRDLQKVLLSNDQPSRQRLRALRLVAPKFAELPGSLLAKLATDADKEIRSQVAWLAGIRRKPEETPLLAKLMADSDPLVRRRACEAAMRNGSQVLQDKLVDRLSDDDRLVRYCAMVALTHQPVADLIRTSTKASARTRIRLLTAAKLRKEDVPEDLLRSSINKLVKETPTQVEDQLDLLRLLNLYRQSLRSDEGSTKLVASLLLSNYPHQDDTVAWEQARLIGAFQLQGGFAPLVKQLVSEKDQVTQFHLASCLAEIPLEAGHAWPKKESEMLANWLISTQTGWFAEFGGKGLQFPQFWATVLNKLGENHTTSLARQLGRLKAGSQLTPIVLSRLDQLNDGGKTLMNLYNEAQGTEAKLQTLEYLARVDTADVARFIQQEYRNQKQPELRRALLIALANNNESEDSDLFINGLLGFDDKNVVSACATALALRSPSPKSQVTIAKAKLGKLTGAKAVHSRLLELMAAYPDRTFELEQALSRLTDHLPPRKEKVPRCIWTSTQQREDDQAWFTKTWKIGHPIKSAQLLITCDNEFKAFINGYRVAESRVWEKPLRIDVSKAVRVGRNLISIEAKNWGGPAGLIAILQWTTEDGEKRQLVTDSSWLVTKSPPKKWKTEGSKTGRWRFATDVSIPTKNAVDAIQQLAPATAAVPKDEALSTQEYWHKWYLQTYREAFVARTLKTLAERSDEEIYRLIANQTKIEGDVAEGRKLYLKAGCYACHGGVDEKKTTIFGPALGGVTLRLKRNELADAIVFPSKQVVERFQASILITEDGRQLSGFITENTDDFVSITDLKNKVTRLPRNEVDEIRAQKKSLMPEKLLSKFKDQEIRNLLAFLQSMK